jgi:hypothetical protein
MGNTISGNAQTNPYPSNPNPPATGGNSSPGGQVAGMPGKDLACEVLHGLAKGLEALGEGISPIAPGPGEVLRGGGRKLDDLTYCRPEDTGPAGWDPGHRTSPELNSDEKMQLKQMLEKMHKDAEDVINKMGR